MNPVERLLQEEVTHFVDRLASSIPPDGVASHALTAAARIRLDDAEAQLAQARASLVEGYGCWRRALEDVLRVLRAIGGVVRLRRGKAACLPRADQRVEADEVDGFLEALAHFVSEARVEIVRAVRMAKGHQASIAARPAPKEIGTSPNVS